MIDHCKRKVQHLYFVQILEWIRNKNVVSHSLCMNSEKWFFLKVKRVDEEFLILLIFIKSYFLVICKTFEKDFFFNTGFLSKASSFWLKNELKLPAKTMAFVSCREKSDKGRSISLSVCSCSVSKFELQRFNKTKKPLASSLSE